jgi:hypothetical protein
MLTCITFLVWEVFTRVHNSTRIKQILDLFHFLKRMGVFDALHIFVPVLSKPVLRRYGPISFHHSFQHTLFDEFHQFGVSIESS